MNTNVDVLIKEKVDRAVLLALVKAFCRLPRTTESWAIQETAKKIVDEMDERDRKEVQGNRQGGRA